MVDDKGKEEVPSSEDNVLILIDPDDGTEHPFEVLELIVVEGNEYVICAPLEGDDGDDAYAFRLVTQGDESYLEEISSEDEWNALAAAWEEAQEEF